MHTAVLLVVLTVGGGDQPRTSLWPAGGLSRYQQKVYARKGHLTRSIRQNPAQTAWMKRYTERDATHYGRIYDYRALYDYPWHVRMPDWMGHQHPPQLGFPEYEGPGPVGESVPGVAPDMIEEYSPAGEPVATPPGESVVTPPDK